MNVALLTKWVKRIVGPEEDLIKAGMRDRYGAGVVWDKMTVIVRGASAFWRGLGKVAPNIQSFLQQVWGTWLYFSFGWMSGRIRGV